MFPTLRFPEFEEEWQPKAIGNICSVKTGRKDTKDKLDEGVYPFFVRSDKVERINTYSYDGEAILTSGDGVGVGKNFHYINGKFDFHQRVYALYNFENDFHGKFIFYNFSKNFFNHVRLLSAKNSVDSVRMAMITDMKLSFPSLPEQKKIADFLTAVDQKIKLLEKKKSLLEDYKKGVMQKIFSQEIRFKDENGQDFPEWEIGKLSDLSDVFDGTHSTPNYLPSGVPFYSVEQVTSNNFNETKFISEEVYQKECARVKIERGDVLLTRIGDIGTPKYIDWDAKASFYVSLALIKCKSKLNGQYLSYCIQSKYFKAQLFRRTIHAAFPKKINLGEIGRCLTPYPSLPEQKKIADFLSALDKKIELVNLHIEKTKVYKKGLLQQMFV